MFGAIVIVCGLYTVLWGQGRELKNKMKMLETARIPENDEAVVVSMPLPSERVIQTYESSTITKESVVNDQ